MKIVAIIPARMGATRFPGKPLADILGIPMIEHVRRRVSLSKRIDRVIVATCDKEILDVVKQHGGEAVMTADTYDRCTDRVAEAALSIDTDIIINVQGDEPLVKPDMLEKLVQPLIVEPNLVCTNLIAEIRSDDEFQTPNEVKVVVDLKDNIVYLSREPIPSVKKAENKAYKRYKQLGIIAFRKDFLHEFTQLVPTPLESIESVDMLRAIEHGYKIRSVFCPDSAVGVDTPEELEYATMLLKNDDLLGQYLSLD
jgi:3-deoxy-manno-octulosonate cytidylyltransferase (CMP-KDO synthetase)